MIKNQSKLPSLEKISQPGLPSTAWLSLLLVPVLLALACNLPFELALPQSTPEPTAEPTPQVQVTPLSVTELTFEVEIPASSETGSQLFLNILDEVTGLAISARSYEMESDDGQHYSVILPFSLGSIVKYRYSLQQSAALVEEHISDGRQLRYRLYHVEGPGIVHDVVTRWTNTKYEGQTGRISGRALDASTGQPIPNLLVVAGGAPALTASDGSFLLEGLPPGVHNLVGYALDGSYLTFQQGAVVAADSTTPAELRVNPARIVSVTFELHVPAETIPAVPIRLAGSLYQLGNTYADLAGGLNTIASRMPVLTLSPDGVYRLTMGLPEGSDVRYLYTLGDGFWNTELFESGERRLRQLIVPEADLIVRDSVDSWSKSDSAPVTFDVTTPPGTPPGDVLSIQFNPFFGWTEPIPMWRLSENRWAYLLNHPLQTISNLHYRFCRNDQCGAADDSATPGVSATGYPLSSSLFAQTMSEDIQSWTWLSPTPPEMTTAPAEVRPRGPGFVAGIEYQPGYHPSWLPRHPLSLEAVASTGANWLFIDPTWTYTRQSPPILEIVSGSDAFWLDLQPMIGQARQRGFNVAIQPTPHFPTQPDLWWKGAARDFSWWVVWFERYRLFVLHHADLAARTGAQALVLGGEWIAPAMPGGLLADGSPSGVPADADSRWRNLLLEVRQRYPGAITWALPIAQASQNPPAFLDAVDSIYILFDAPLSTQPNPARADMSIEAGRLLETSIAPLAQRFNKPVVLGIAYPSAQGSAAGCLPNGAGGCLSAAALQRPEAEIPGLQVDLGEQEEIYAAVLDAVNAHPWISGIISRGFYPPAALQDYSASVHGKPAEAVLRYWYPRLLAAP